LSLLAAFIPAVPNSVSTTLIGSEVKVQWQLSTENGSEITLYMVQIQTQSGIFETENIDCDGSTTIVIAQRYCYIDISTLIQAPFELVGGESIIAQVAAANLFGQSEFSASGNGAIYYTAPDAPVNLIEDRTGKLSDTLNLVWLDGPSDGGQPVQDYRVSLREQGGAFEVIGYVVPQKSITAYDLVLGTTYEFKVEARNEIGYSPASEIYSILHALAPEQPLAPTTVNSGTEVLISWIAPSDRGSAITSYTISI